MKHGRDDHADKHRGSSARQSLFLCSLVGAVGCLSLSTEIQQGNKENVYKIFNIIYTVYSYFTMAKISAVVTARIGILANTLCYILYCPTPDFQEIGLSHRVLSGFRVFWKLAMSSRACFDFVGVKMFFSYSWELYSTPHHPRRHIWQLAVILCCF